MSSNGHSFDPSKVKPEPVAYEWEDWVTEPQGYEAFHGYAPEYQQGPMEYAVAPQQPQQPQQLQQPQYPEDLEVYHQAPTTSPYKSRMEELDYLVAMEENYMNLTNADEQQWLREQVAKKERAVIARTPWMKNRPEARATTKFRQMQLGIRKEALKEFEEQRDWGQRRNPRRSAAANLKEGAYKVDEGDEVEFLGYYRDGKRKKPTKKRVARK